MKPDTPSPSRTRHAGSPMSRATPDMRDFAEGLIDYEAKESTAPGTRARAAFHVCEKLRPRLASLLGSAGFSALLGRALALATAEIPALRVVQLQADGSLAVPDGPEAQAAAGKLAEGGVVLVAQLVGLLAAFIGEALMLRVVRGAGPGVIRGNVSDKGEVYEKKN